MLNSNHARFLVILCFALGAAACGDDASPTAPTTDTEPEPEPGPVTISGEWHGEFDGALVAGEAFATLEQNGMDVTGDWSAEMPAPLVALGAPDVDLAGPVEGTVSGSTAELEFGFLPVFNEYLGEDCGLHVHVESFTEDDLEATWHTEDTCPDHVNDEGTLDMHKD